MTALSPLVHFALVLADSLDRTVDELPNVADDARITLSALARGLELTAERIKRDEAEREARVLEKVHG